MVSWPDLGTRVTVRYRRHAGSIPPLTDAVGHLLAVDPVVRVRTKTGTVVECAPADVVALRILTDAPVRTSEIRALEHAAAAAWPGMKQTWEQTWLDGWLLRAGPDAELEANSAVPLDISARTDSIPAIVAWYADRGLTPRLAIPDRLLRVPAGLTAEREERMLVRDAPLDNDSHPGASSGEFAGAAVSDAPDGTRWVGLSAISAVAEPGAPSCEALLAWGAQRGATRAYVRIGDHDTNAIALAESLGFRLHHRRRYVRPTG
ncbi:GNAT family N-acetyltransferase, cg3035/Rv0428c family [Mycobacterium sp.]|uniref:GNAT family N-acetyltransferase, cg3035/Rv0428c family n=1 Tax=Mycobacterium sp. TaxID=1785 RepID=UPI003F9A5644